MGQQQRAGASGRQRGQQKQQADVEPWRAFKSLQQQGQPPSRGKARGPQPKDDADWRGARQGDPSTRAAASGGGLSNSGPATHSQGRPQANSGPATHSQGRPQAELQSPPASQSTQQDSGFLSWWD